MNNNTIRIGLIGAGRAGFIHAKNYAGAVNGAMLTAVADPSEEALEEAKKEFRNIAVYTDYHDLLDSDSVDAVVVVTPTDLHRDVVIAAARKRKHVICEKPMAINTEECAAMIEACRTAGVKLQIAFMRRFDNRFRYAKQQIDAGVIGKTVTIRSLTHGPSKPKPWMLDIHKSNGPLAEVSSHDIDTLRWFAGSEIVELYATGGNYRCDFAKDEYPDFYDNVVVSCTFANGMQGIIEGAVYVQYGYDSRVEVLGTEGIIMAGTIRDQPVTTVTRSQQLIEPAVPSWRNLFIDAYRSEDQGFIDCIRRDTTPEVTGMDGFRAVQIVNAGNLSIREHRIVRIDLMEGIQ